MKKMTYPSFEEEKKLWEKGFKYVIGIDEVGRGAFAGPLVVGAVVFLKVENEIEKVGINDSKLLKPQKRTCLAKIINENCLCSHVVTIPVSTINKVGIGKTTQIGFRKVVTSIMYKVSSIKYENEAKFFVLIDGFHVRYLRGFGLKNQRAIIKGDQKSISIASASIIAKVHRDKIMKNLSKKYPQYGFGRNKGYGTKFHRDAIKNFGICRIHRKNFTSCKEYVHKI